VAGKVDLIPHPISSGMKYNGEKKGNYLCAVGRWTRQDRIKNPVLLMKSFTRVLRDHPKFEAIIVGSYDQLIEDIWKTAPGSIRRRIHLLGPVTNEKTSNILRKSRILLCTSRSESFHIASGEALCCGCSLVSYRSPFLPSFSYFVAENCGTLAESDKYDLLGEALSLEVRKWDEGERIPENISEIWSSRLHADRVAARIVDSIREFVDAC
jgi:glycosyltransferase involved in cell wall biosynthesis